MTDVVHESLKKMAVGTSIILAGTIVSMLFEFLSRILIIRSTSTAEYGVFALALVILNITVIIATLGLQDGATRQIAYYRGRGELERVYSTVVSSLELTAVALCNIVMYATAGTFGSLLREGMIVKKHREKEGTADERRSNYNNSINIFKLRHDTSKNAPAQHFNKHHIM